MRPRKAPTEPLTPVSLYIFVLCHRMLGDASMVLSLEQIRNIEDKNLLAGHTMVLLDRDTAQAQVCFRWS